MQLMDPINLQQTEFESEQDLKNYLKALVLEYAGTMNRIEMETFLKSESKEDSTSDLFEEYKAKYLPVFTAYCSDRKRVYGGKASAFGCPTQFDGIEEHVESDVVLKNANRAEVYFKTTNYQEAEYLFVVVRKKGLWRIDSAKERTYKGLYRPWHSMIL